MKKGFTPTPIFPRKIGVSLQSKRGFITTILLIIIALAALKYFLNFSIFDAAASEQGQGTIAYLRDVISTVWSYIGAPVTYAWNEVVKPLFIFAFDSLRQMLEEGRGALSQ